MCVLVKHCLHRIHWSWGSVMDSVNYYTGQLKVVVVSRVDTVNKPPNCRWLRLWVWCSPSQPPLPSLTPSPQYKPGPLRGVWKSLMPYQMHTSTIFATKWLQARTWICKRSRSCFLWEDKRHRQGFLWQGYPTWTPLLGLCRNLSALSPSSRKIHLFLPW